MTTMTLRGLDDSLAALLKKRASGEGLSVNAFVLRTIKEALGVEHRKRAMQYADLDALAGTWSAKDAESFTRAIEPFETIDEDLWKP